jgi:hypothetical protein
MKWWQQKLDLPGASDRRNTRALKEISQCLITSRPEVPRLRTMVVEVSHAKAGEVTRRGMQRE